MKWFFKKNRKVQISMKALHLVLLNKYKRLYSVTKIRSIVHELEQKGIISIVRLEGQANKYVYIPKNKR